MDDGALCNLIKIKAPTDFPARETKAMLPAVTPGADVSDTCSPIEELRVSVAAFRT